ncbi:DUF6597 domain-containing transcriptional factor [Undibacterium sp. TJN25]|uniref:DUF6597 domain-containing transcriptional factor n=1 Tax=Undibacterium sp. TJN25 TaxID=3413056 RepID=UPI003BF11505
MILYQEYSPRPALSAFVECLWTCSVGKDMPACSHKVLPDNGIDILWQDCNPGGFAVGMMTSSSVVTMESPLRTIAVRFKPGCAAYFFLAPLSELTDERADIGNLWDRGLDRQIADALWARPITIREQLDVIEHHLLQRLAISGKPQARGLVAHAVAQIESAGGLLKIESLADAVGVSRQHLATQFRARVGIPAKTFARICRFRRTMEDIRATHAPARKIDWAQLALDRGYFDQPHLIHEFRAFSGSSPDAFAAELSIRT